MSRSLALLFGSLILGATSVGLAKPLDTIRPEVMIPSSTNPAPGDAVTITVTLSSAASQPGSLSIFGTAGGFAVLPTSVPVQVGDTSETFTVQVASGATGTLKLVALNDYGTASTQLMVKSGGGGVLQAVKF